MIINIYNSYCIVENATPELELQISNKISYTNQSVSYEVYKLKKRIKALQSKGVYGKRLDFQYVKLRELESFLTISLYGLKSHSFPTGLIDIVEYHLQREGIKYQIVDHRKKPEKYLFLEDKIKVFPYRRFQKEALDICVEKGRAAIESVTASGKTFLISSLIKELGVRTLIVVPTINILNQTYKHLKNRFGIKNTGIWGAGRMDGDKDIVVASVQTLQRLKPADFKGFDCLVIDECFSGKTRVRTDQGLKSFKWLYDNPDFKGKVLTFNEKEKKFEYKNIKRVIRKKAPDILLEGKRGWQHMRCTPDHKFLTERGWIQIKDIKSNDMMVAYPHESDPFVGYVFNDNLDSCGVINPIKTKPIDNTQKAIRDSGLSGYVYDLTMEDNHNYVLANGLVAHNCHHSAAETYQELNLECFAHIYYRFFFSGTMFRNDGSDLALLGVINSIDYRYGPKKAIEDKVISPPVFFMVCNQLNQVPIKEKSSYYKNIYKKYIVNNMKRNEIIVEQAHKFRDLGKQVLILVDQITHGNKLLPMLQDTVFVNSKTPNNDKVIEQFNAGELPILMGTEVIGEGVDTTGADVLIMASGGKAKSSVMQNVGRVLRLKEGKDFAVVVDFLDQNVEPFSKHSRERTRIYKDEYDTVLDYLTVN